MREIKFRAWDKKNNRWAYSTEVNIELSGQVIHEHWHQNGHKDEFYPCKPDIFDATYEEVKP